MKGDPCESRRVVGAHGVEMRPQGATYEYRHQISRKSQQLACFMFDRYFSNLSCVPRVRLMSSVVEALEMVSLSLLSSPKS